MAQDQPIYTDSVIREWKFRNVVLTIGRDVLHTCVLSCCTETIEEIAEKCKVGKLEIQLFSGKLIKKTIYSTDREKAKKDTSGLKFDITFLSQILLLIEGDHPSFYKKIVAVKDLRNAVSHNSIPLDEEVYKKQLKDFEDDINEILKEAELVSNKQKPKVSCQANLDQISEGILKIQALKSDLSDRIAKMKSEPIVESDAGSLDYIKVHGQIEIIKSYDDLISVNPVDFFVGTGHKHPVSEFYTELEFFDKKEECSILQKDVFEMAESGSSNIIIEGNSGFGKTMLIRQIMADKKDKTNNESLLIHFACRNSVFSSLKDLLAHLMPKASRIFLGKKLTTAILLLKPVFLVDGLDELNHNSKKILDEIIAYVKRDDATIFATSRPEGVKQFLNKMTGTETKYLEIRGILKERQQEIVEKYMKIFSPTTSAPSLEEVTRKLDELRKSLGTYMGVPLIICLLVYLILNTKEIDSKSTLSEVYNAITDALIDKLKSRIMNSSDPLTDRGRDRKVKKLFLYVCDLSYRSLKNGELILTEDTTLEIDESIDQIFGHGRDDVMSSLFVCRGSITAKGHKNTYSFLHKSFQEFFAAKHIEETLSNDKSARFWELVDDSYSERNLLHFTIGIMALKEPLRSDICEVIAEKCNTPFTCFEALTYSNWHPSMLKAVNNKCRYLYFRQRKDDIEDLQKILKEECPRMTKVDLTFELQSNEASSSIVNIMSLLKKKNLKIELHFNNPDGETTTYHCDAYIGALHGGRSRLKHFEGCLGEEGINNLPNHLELLVLHIGSHREAEGLQRLRNYGKRSFRRLYLKIQSRKFDALLLPKKFPIPWFILDVSFQDVKKEDLPWILEVMDRLPRRRCWWRWRCCKWTWTSETKCEDITIDLHGLKSEDEDAAIQFLEGLKGKSFQKMKIDLWRHLRRSQLLPKHKSTLKSLEEEGIFIK